MRILQRKKAHCTSVESFAPSACNRSSWAIFWRTNLSAPAPDGTAFFDFAASYLLSFETSGLEAFILDNLFIQRCEYAHCDHGDSPCNLGGIAERPRQSRQDI